MNNHAESPSRKKARPPASPTPSADSILTINGGSSSIRFGLFRKTGQVRRILSGKIERIGLPDGTFSATGDAPADNFSISIAAPDHRAAIQALSDWTRERIPRGTLCAVGHRFVHGGPDFWETTPITPGLLKKLREFSAFDPEHLPEEILLAEAFQETYPELPQFACFDTAFHHDMPRVAQRIALPRRFQSKGVRRYGFHGISCAYLLEALSRVAGPDAAMGRVVLAHLGNGASATAVWNKKSIDTSMGFTPTSGFPMSTRSGDLDPGLARFLAQAEGMTSRQFHQMVNHDSGLLGISETSSDMADLLEAEKTDIRAAEAVETFCYQAKKWICAMAGALGGLDTLVFSGGIGENCPPIRERMCQGLGFLGIELDATKNDSNAATISTAASRVAVRVIATDEEWMIADLVSRQPVAKAPSPSGPDDPSRSPSKREIST